VKGNKAAVNLLTGAGNREPGTPSGGALLTMMKSADLRHRNNAPGRWRLYLARMRAVVEQGLMRASGVVVGEVPAQEASEMTFVDHEDVIEAFASNRPDDALGEGILPGRPGGDENLAHPQAFHAAGEDFAVDSIAIAEEVLGRCLFREAFDQLVSCPGGAGVVGGVDMDEFPTVVSKDQEPEEQLEGEGGDDEEVDGDNPSRRCAPRGRCATSRTAAARGAACTWPR